MTIYDPAPGPSRASRITLPPMMMMVPQTHERPLEYTHDLSQPPYLRNSYMAQPDYEYDYEFTASMSYQPTNEYQLPPASHAGEMQSSHNNHDGNGPLSLSLLVAAAHAAQADISYGHPPIPFPSNLPLSCGMESSGNYSPSLTSADARGTWPSVGLATGTSDSERLAVSPPHTPLATPDVIYDTSMMTCCRSQNDGTNAHEPKWSMGRMSAEPQFLHKPSLPPLSHMEYSNHGIAAHHHHHTQPTDFPTQQSSHLISAPLAQSEICNPSSCSVIKRTCKRKEMEPQFEEHESSTQDEHSPESQTSPKNGKPKQGRKKRSAGYVRPIIIHRKRVGQRLLDMLKSAPIPSKAPSMELSRARCFPFADMKNKLREWYGLQIEWPAGAPFSVDELRSTRRMRLDELERLDKTLDGGEVRLRLSDEVLAEEPHRTAEYSLPSEGNTDEHSYEFPAADHHPYDPINEFNETVHKRRKRKL
ncbi:hypothetical protein MJO29_001307 [Puccinia striiformis f. sp. tritici]|uniref:Uncharacterized protein n=2 Tax=Puccinia striiformis TaxID=27350 RepID=A0A2S4VP08_9BASI|nr:hypothetical protein MJO29_001307 [Puccinia striiformis f. sp. tritici]KAI9611640.1 hypothetical protein H4Q26_008595 [Puccinia striiformis f. sp. tritici PST-130]POW11261.1 hypothetical protein PSTT_05457 [Puccinia striiformis]